MGANRPVARILAAMILAIVAYLAPSAVQAHAGPVDCGHRGANQTIAAKVVAEPTPRPELVRSVRKVAMPAHLSGYSVLRGRTVSSGSLRADDAGPGCSRACMGCACGSMACCGLAIVTGHASLTVPPDRIAVLIPRDAAGHPGVGPGALRRPPRPLA